MKNLPISYKFLRIITVLILLMLFLLGSNYITYQSLTEESALRTLGNSTEQAAAELDTYFSDLSHLSLVPMSQKYDSYDFAHIIEESSSGSKAFNSRRFCQLCYAQLLAPSFHRHSESALVRRHAIFQRKSQIPACIHLSGLI